MPEAEFFRSDRYSATDLGGTVQQRVALRDFDIDDRGVARAQVAQFLADGTGLVRVVEPLLTIMVSGPSASPAAGIPARDPLVGFWIEV
jgi:hypothetical protein